MRVLITGICGFAGSHLAQRLLNEGHVVHGIDHPAASAVRLVDIRRQVSLQLADMMDSGKIRAILQSVKPEWIFHLAGQANVGKAWNQREQTLQINIFGGFNVFEATRTWPVASRPRIIVAGSGEQYGLVPREAQPINENTPLLPRTPYAASKACLELLSRQYAAAGEADVVILRLFNHIGPGQALGFAAADFADQIARIELGGADPIVRVGNLEAVRDFCDVRDIAQAYIRAAERGMSGAAYNVASGQPVRIRDLLNQLIALARVSIRIEQDPARSRPADVPSIVGDASRFRRDTGWSPSITLHDSLKDVLDYWRSRAQLADHDR